MYTVMINVPFYKRVILIGDWKPPEAEKERFRRAVKSFRFDPDPNFLKREYGKLDSVPRRFFGCIDADSMRDYHADWLAGGSLNSRLYGEEVETYYILSGGLHCVAADPSDYHVFMSGTGKYLGDTDSIFAGLPDDTPRDARVEFFTKTIKELLYCENAAIYDDLVV